MIEVTDMLTFQKAIAETKLSDRVLLIGNGFSSEFFNYRTLLDKSNFGDNDSVRHLFEELDTVDFEMVISALEHAAIVERVYGHCGHASELEEDANTTREVLVNAIREAHPEKRTDLDSKYETTIEFLENFENIFSLNYDLLLYWTIFERDTNRLPDGFGKGKYTEDNRFFGPFQDDAYCKLFYLHGGLHLFLQGEGEVYKAVRSGGSIINTISHEISERKNLPIFVAEGNTELKMKKINSIAYLRHCYRKLQANSATVFIFGHSASAQDEHIYRAIFSSYTDKVYFGVHNSSEEKLARLSGDLAKYQEKYRKHGNTKIEYTFFDSAGANIWQQKNSTENAG